MSDESSTTDRPPPPWQFSLRTVFLVFVVVASALGAFGTKGVFVGAFVLGIAVCVHWAEARCGVWVVLLVLLVLLALFGVVLPLPVSLISHPASYRRASCMNNLKQIALSVLSYWDRDGSFPPAYVADENGKPMHSWRVLILPYIEKNDLYDAYDFNEAWDGPNNAKLAQTPLRLFRCPSESNVAPLTNYVAVVGPNTMWPGAEGVSPDDIPDGAAETILLIEWPDSDIHWMEPRDVSFEELCGATGSKSRRGLHGAHDVGDMWFHHSVPIIHAAMADGSVRRLPANISAEQFAALLTRNGGEPIDWDAFEFRPTLNWGRILSLVMFALSSLWLIARPPGNAERRMRET